MKKNKYQNIAIVTHHCYPTDQEIRVTKFIKAFTKKGFFTTVYCLQKNDESSFKSESFEIFGKKSDNTSFIQRLIDSPLPINFFWTFWLFRNFRKKETNVVIVRDLRLFIPAYFAGKLHGIKIILDIGEHYPGMVEVLGKQKIAHYITRNIFLITLLEALSIYLADSVWVVAEENKKRLLKYNQSINVIGNSPIDDSWKRFPIIKPKEYMDNGEPFKLISFGLLDNIRGIEYAIDIVNELIKKLPNTVMIIYGDGPFKKDLEQKVKKMELNYCIEFMGWTPGDKKYQSLQEGDLGILFHKVCNLTNHTIPNKLFDYMSMGLPVVSTNLMPIKRIIKKEKCGYIISNDLKIATEQMIEIIIDHKKRVSYSHNGRNAMLKGYKWSEDESNLLHYLDNL